MRVSTLHACVLALTLGTAGDALAAGPVGKWLGQDGKDFVGLVPKPGPNGVVDIHVALNGLPREPIVWLQVTGVGVGRWHTDKPDLWRAHLVRAGTSDKADLYFEPCKLENADRDFELQIQFKTGPVVYVWVKGGKADPALRTAASRASAKWVGMTTEDHVGDGSGVGPDGRHDAKISLSHLAAGAPVESIRVETKDGAAWVHGVDLDGVNNALFLPDPKDPTRGDFFLQPTKLREGQNLSVRITYKGGAADLVSVVAGKTVADSVVPVPKLPRFVALDKASVKDLGQDGTRRIGLGDVHLLLQGVPRDKAVVGAELSDRAGTTWVWKSPNARDFRSDAGAFPLSMIRSADGSTWDIAYPPVSPEKGRLMTLRLGFADGRIGLLYVMSGKADPELRSPAPAETSIDARPGDDLQDLANKFGTVRLAAGVFKLTKPLVLNKPVNLVSQAGATLEFAQPPNDKPWTAAIKVHAGRTTLSGFSVKFAGPVKWDLTVGHGPALIGTTDDRDQGSFPEKFGIAVRGLKITAPPASSGWEQTPTAIRLTNASCGRVEDNTIEGGGIEIWGGPWTIARNTHLGTVPNTHTPGVICGHYTHDLVVEGNKVRAATGNGKTWRFLVLTQRGYRDLVRDNQVVGIGARKEDPHQHENAPEIILTEAYRIRFEGRPSFLQGSLLKTPPPQGEPASAGDVIAILTGPNAGQWGTVIQNIGDSTYLLDRAWPAGTDKEVIALVSGFVEDRFENNLVDTTGSTICYNLVLAGNQFGATVEKNTFKGGGLWLMMLATASESPYFWGWSRVPVFGATVVGNRVEDAWNGSRIGVEHSQYTKKSKGRLYLKAVLKDNEFSWSDAFTARRLQDKSGDEPSMMTINDPKPLDPAEVSIKESGNRRVGGTGIPSIRIRGALINDKPHKAGVGEFSPSAAASKTQGRLR